MFGCGELTSLFYPFKVRSQNDVRQGGMGDSSTGQERAEEEETERKRTGKRPDRRQPKEGSRRIQEGKTGNDKSRTGQEWNKPAR